MTMDFGKILKRAWRILWDYKVLWIFGLLLALFTGMGGASGNGMNYRFGGNNNGNNGYHGVVPETPQVQAMNHWFQAHLFPLFTHPLQHLGLWALVILGIVLFFALLGLVFALVRYPAEAAVMRMVDNYEQSGEKVGFRAGWKLGWTKRALRMWWINFLTQDLPGLVLLVILLGIGVGTFFAIYSGRNFLGFASVVGGAILVAALILVFSLGFVFVRLLMQFFWRKIALENAGTKQAFRDGWAMFKRNWKNALLMWLIMVGIKIGVGIAMAIAFVLLIPVYLVTLIPALIVGAIPGLIAFGIASLFTGAPWTWIIGLVFFIPFFFLVLFSPLAFVYGWYYVYDSSAWTLAYREMKALEVVSPSAPNTPAAPGDLPAPAA